MYQFIFIINIILCLNIISDERKIFNEYVVDISPNSKNILTYQAINNDVTVKIWDANSVSKIYEKKFENNKLNIILFSSDTTYIVFFKNKTAININRDQKTFVKELDGIHPRCANYNAKSRNLTIVENIGDIEGEKVKMGIYSFNLDTKNLNRWYFKRSGAFVSSIVAYDTNTFILNYEGNIVMLNIKTSEWKWLYDKNGKQLEAGESKINLNCSKQFLLFSSSNKGGLTIYNLNTQEFSHIKGYENYIFPLLSPDGTYFVAEKEKSENYEAEIFHDISFVVNPQ